MYISGLLSGLYGIGALLAAYVSRTTDNDSAFRGNLCIVFIVENTFRIILYFLTGVITVEVVKKAVILLPFLFLGLFLGMMLRKVLKEKTVKKIVIIFLILSGISLVLCNLK